jgi:hypothetical protein
MHSVFLPVGLKGIVHSMTIVGLCRESSKALSFRGWKSAILDSVTMAGESSSIV